jgi:hypothetical protein
MIWPMARGVPLVSVLERSGVWADIHDAVLEAEGRDPAPTAAVLDSQSAKSACGWQAIGFDAGNKVHGRNLELSNVATLSRGMIRCGRACIAVG